jgi:DNA-binding GntR family transcriptional regulator
MSVDHDFILSSDESLRNKVYKHIKEQIISGVHGPGDTLLESKLAEELGVSRTPVREAIHQLELEGLVEVSPKKGAAVLGISSKDVEDIYAIRQLVEGLAARRATEHLTESELKELQKIFDLMEFYANKQDLEEVTQLDNRFHQIIYEATHSKILLLTLSNLHQYVRIARLESLKYHDRLPHTIEEHRAILKAFLDKDPDLAEKALANHVKMAHINITDQSPEVT